MDEYALMQKLPLQKIQELFADQRVTIDRKAPANASLTASAEQELVSILDGKRVQNITIMLSRFKIPLTELRAKVLSCTLDADSVTLIRPHLATQDEANALKSVDSSTVLFLGRPERFLLEMLKIPFVTERFAALTFMSSFPDRYSEVENQVTLTNRAASQILQSNALKSVLKHFLAVINLMNGSSSRGNAYGFRLRSIEAILNMKCNDGKGTMADFLLESMDEATLRFPEELSAVTEVSNVNVKQVIKDVSTIIHDIEECEGVIRKAEAAEAVPGDLFLQKVKQFSTDAKQKVQHLKQSSSEMEGVFRQACIFMADDEADSEMFIHINSLLRAYSHHMRLKKLAAEKKPAGKPSSMSVTPNLMAELRKRQNK